MAAQTNTNSASSNIDINTPYTPRRPTPLLSISVNHPIATAFRKVKNFLTHKQTLFSTTFTIKITPIVAIVSLFGLAGLFGGGVTTAFNFGRTVEQKFLASAPSPTPRIIVTSPAPIPVIVTREGVVTATYRLEPDKSARLVGIANTPAVIPTFVPVSQAAAEMPLSPTPTIFIVPTGIPLPTPQRIALRYVLLSRSGSITFLAAPAVPLQNYLNLRVLVTGSLDTTKNTLTVKKAEDIEVLQ